MLSQINIPLKKSMDLQCVIVVYPGHTHLLLDLSITSGIVSYISYYKWDDFYFEIVNFQFLVRDLSLSPSYGVFTTITYFSTKYFVMCKVYTDVGGIK